jgi:hypothetical protein
MGEMKLVRLLHYRPPHMLDQAPELRGTVSKLPGMLDVFRPPGVVCGAIATPVGL